MSPRAAWQLERLGFGPVYGYAAGKVDRMAAGLPTVRADTIERRAFDAVDADPPTCRPDVTVTVAARVASDAGWASVVGYQRRADRARASGPELVRGPGRRVRRRRDGVGASDGACARAAGRSIGAERKRHAFGILVTAPEGRLLGAIQRR
jgi:hypothetical protein